MILTGAIIKRRSLGRSLAFADVLSDDNSVESVAFRVDSFLEQEDNAFPAKKSALPYGAQVELTVQEATREGPRWEVLTWKVLNDQGHEQAMQQATLEGGGTSCSKYLQIRAENYFKLSDHRVLPPSENVQTTESEDTSNYAQAKSLRSKIFATWLMETIKLDANTDRVLDVAGGKGQLSVELAKMGSIPCTVIDPVVRKRLKMKQLVKHNKPVPQFRAHCFRRDDSDTMQALADCTCLIGLHPDEPTEDIVDLALQHNKSFAVVPCCVFPSFFPTRKLESGEFVNTYEQFLEYLMQKDNRIEKSTLSLEGKNQVIYLKVL